VLAVDECHLRWGDTPGYVWGRRNERTAVFINNAQQKQTYYGALNLYNQEFIIAPYECGNSESTISFIQYLKLLHEDNKLILIWDGASYHRSQAVQTYLHEVNQGLAENDWRVHCLLLAPNAPDQNPVEDAWLKGKNFLRTFFFKNKTFQQVKSCFFNFLHQKVFSFEKPKWYLENTQPI